MRIYRSLLLLLFIAAGPCGTLANELNVREERINQLLKLLEKPEPFAAITEKEVEQAKTRLDAKMAELDRQLARIGAEQTARWKKYLKWSDLEAQLAAEKPNRSALIEVSRKFQMNQPGLELKVFRDVREAIVDYANLSYFGSEAIAKRIYDSRLRVIKSALEKLKPNHDDRTVGLLGEAVTDLDNSGNCPELVAAIRKAFAKPNFHFQVSEQLAKTVLKKRKTVDRQPVNEVIVGVPQRGTAETTARFDVDFLPSIRSGKFKFIINGNTLSDTVGTKELGLLGSVYICSEGQTSLIGEAIIEFDGKRISYSNIAAGARTKSSLKGVDTPFFLRNATLNQIQRKKSQGEAEAAAKARTKFVRQIRTELNNTVRKTNSKLDSGVRTTIRRLDFEPKKLEVTTSDDFFRVLAIVGNKHHLTTLEGPDSEVKGDIITQLHESTVNNGLQHILGGRTISMKEMRQLITSFGVELPPPPADDKPLSITFPRVRPVQVSFEGQQVTTVISANEIQSGRTVVKDDLKITITYKVDSTADTVTVERAGDVQIDFKGEYTNAKSVIESVIKPKLEKAFKKETRQFQIADIELPPEFEDVGLPEISRLQIDKGWVIAELGMNEGKVAKSVPIKKLSGVRIINQFQNGVPIKPLQDGRVRTAFISDSQNSFRSNR